MIRRLRTICCLLAVLAGARPLAAAPPQVAQLSPLAVTPGETVDDLSGRPQHLVEGNAQPLPELV